MRLDTLRNRIALAMLAAAVAGAALAWATRWLPAWSLAAIAVAGATAAFAFAGHAIAPLKRLLRALESAVLSYRDGDFSVAIAATHDDELGDLVRRHRELGLALHAQRQHLTQRELLLDTVVQNTPVALLLTDARERVVYANLAARQLLGAGRSLEGSDFGTLLRGAPDALGSAVASGADTLFAVTLDGSEETFHASQRSFQLQGRPHRLHLIRRMTRELSRQEVATWKRVIRVISHELNNSLAPISSLAHSGAELVRRGDADDKLPEVFATIGRRARHLHAFLDGYSRFAKLPAPWLDDVALAPFLRSLAAQHRCTLAGDATGDGVGRFDAAQVEQALINLLRNAHESGGDIAAVTLAIAHAPGELRFEVADRGPGMGEAVLSQALLPFYSTKRAGTGLGLALAREIAEAHGGRIALANRAGGGLRVTLTLPSRPPSAGPV